MSNGLSTVIGRRALKFPSRDGFKAGMERYSKAHPDAYLAVPGNHVLVVDSEYFDELTTELESDGIEFSEETLRSMADLSPEEAAQLRRSRGFRGQPEDRQKVLDELRRRYGVS